MHDLPKRDAAPAIAVGDTVRVYNDDDWFYEGHVVEVGNDIIVSFGTWCDAFSPSDLQESWLMMRRVLTAHVQGRCVSGVQKSVDGEE